ncbi:type II toxin-antitoxin system antitoxin DNA ADP-ribosyl glycohydrolase DarG [Luedemannella helvata]
MITEASGNLLDAEAEALVNTVNTAGVMGKGLALQFKRAYPDMFREYARVARAGQIELGRMHVWPTGRLTDPRYIINFPTKGHWRARSRLADVDRGLEDLVRVIKDLGIKSVALPPLGCGNGGLAWTDVRPLIWKAMSAVPDVHVVVYPPGPTPAAELMRTATPMPPLTVARASVIHLLSRYIDRALEASLIEVQKLMYFLQVAGEPLKLNYAKGLYGPYADNARHALQTLEGHYLIGFGDGSALVREAEPLRLLPGADVAAHRFLAGQSLTLERIDRVMALIEGFESAYGMELLSTVHWVATHNDPAASSAASAAELVQAWSRRKERMFTSEHVATAWDALRQQGWVTAA